jgi:putative ABC transport system permease protein
MSVLDRKLLRDLVHMWAQALAIALVMAAGVATLILAIGAYRSLLETRDAYYERYRFADVFASATRAPVLLERQIAAIPGVASVETRISRGALLDIAGLAEPASGLALSLPDHAEPKLNRLHVRQGRLPEPGSVNEVTVNESFAKANGFAPGARFHALMNGRKRLLTVVGIALSPEFIYAVGPGDVIPDDRRFGVLWMSRRALEAIYDLDGAFNDVSIALLRGASAQAVIDRVDQLLARYGGRAGYARKDQQSHAFIEAELTQLQAMSKTLPPIFLVVAAFLINMTLSRLITLEREQIGLLKALGYGRFAIALHYIKFVLAIALVGIVVGSAAGTWLGHGLTRLYADFFHFPFLIFRRSVDLYLIAAAISAFAAVLGGLRAAYAVMMLPPAVAMAPPAPDRYGHLWSERLGVLRHFSQLTVMVLRHMVRRPLRSLVTMFGIAMALALLVTSFFFIDSTEHMIDVTFFQADRQDASIQFTDKSPVRSLQAVTHFPGVLVAEPYRAVAARLHHGHRTRRIGIVGKQSNTDLSRLLDLDLKPVTLPRHGIVLTEMLGRLLDVRPGDIVAVELLEENRRAVTVPVSALIQSYIGISAYMDLGALNKLLDEGPVISGAHVAFDTARRDDLFRAIKNLPAVSGITLQKVSLQKFRETMAQNITIMTMVYVGLSVIIAFGVVYNSARIHLSERARELASLRVLGFTRTEVSRILLVELAVTVAGAVPLGWLLGLGLAWLTIQGFESELYRAPFVVEHSTLAQSTLIVLAAAAISALIVRRRIDTLDLIAVLKTRD